jgi:putative sterol carrier protein
MQLFDEEWVGSLTARLAADADFQKKAKGFRAVYQYVIKAAPEKGVAQDHLFAIRYPEAAEYWMGRHDKPDYTMTTSYQVMHDILAGKTSAIAALTGRKAFVSGNLPNLLRFTGAINRIVAVMQQMPAEAEGDFGAM